MGFRTPTMQALLNAKNGAAWQELDSDGAGSLCVAFKTPPHVVVDNFDPFPPVAVQEAVFVPGNVDAVEDGTYKGLIVNGRLLAWDNYNSTWRRQQSTANGCQIVTLFNSTRSTDAWVEPVGDGMVNPNTLLTGAHGMVYDPDADRWNRSRGDAMGHQVVVPYQDRPRVVDQYTALTDASETTVLAAGGTGVLHDLVAVLLSNTDTSPVTATLRDGTAGTVRGVFVIPANDTKPVVFTVPLKQAAAATVWTLQLSAAVTVHVTVQAVLNT